MNLEELRKKYLDNGFLLANASAKICQDIILNKISKSKMNKNVTIKGGVVMYGLSNDKRRTTRDLDLDFIKYSLADESIKAFIDTLIIKDTSMREKNIYDIINNLNITLNNNIFKRSLSDARNNWLGISVEEVIDNVINYFKTMEIVGV